MSRVLGNIQRSNNVFSFKCISFTIGRSNFKLCRYIGHIMLTAMLHNTLSRSNKIFHVNAFPPKPLDIAASNFAGA